MRALKVDDENLRNQRDVVKEKSACDVNGAEPALRRFPVAGHAAVAFRNWCERA